MYDKDDLEFIQSLFDIDASSRHSTEDWTDEKELDDLWQQYDSFVQELKAEGYKILRNSSGKHKVVKNDG